MTSSIRVRLWATVAIGVLLAGTACGAGGKKLGYDSTRLEKRCGVTADTVLTEEQARCVAHLAGLRDNDTCSTEIVSPDAEEGSEGVYYARETCSGVALFISRNGGRIVAVEARDGAVAERPDQLD